MVIAKHEYTKLLQNVVKCWLHFAHNVQPEYNFLLLRSVASRTVNQNTNKHPTWHQCADFFLPECYRWRYHIAHETLETMIWSWLLRKQQLTLDGILQLRVHNHCAVQRTVMNQMGLLASLLLWLTIWNETNRPSWINFAHALCGIDRQSIKRNWKKYEWL